MAFLAKLKDKEIILKWLIKIFLELIFISTTCKFNSYKLIYIICVSVKIIR